MIVAVFAVLGVIGLALACAALFPWLASRFTDDDEVEDDPYGFWTEREWGDEGAICD